MNKRSFPALEFNNWAESYDISVTIDQFPFFGYTDVLAKILSLTQPDPGFSILDLGTGTGNLALLFARIGCNLSCTDFSEPMLAKARQKIPTAKFFLHDLHKPLMPELDHRFDGIVSAYVFHHFKLAEKIVILLGLQSHLAPGGKIVIGDIAFTDRIAEKKVKVGVGEGWDDEFYWIVSESIPALAKAGFTAEYTQVSACAGVFLLKYG